MRLGDIPDLPLVVLKVLPGQFLMCFAASRLEIENANTKRVVGTSHFNSKVLSGFFYLECSCDRDEASVKTLDI